MKASDFVARYLEARGVTYVFELVGGMITHLLDSISDSSQIAIVSCHHEQAAAFAAEGHARISGIPGIALDTSGPGATNLLTGIGSCYFDSIPAVFITGQVNTHELKGMRGVGVHFDISASTNAYLQSPVPHASPSIEKISQLGWMPSIGISEGFTRTILSFL